MQRRKSKSLKKPVKRVPSKKNECSVCDMGRGVVIQTQHALYRKYSSQHYSYLEEINEAIKKPQQPELKKQFMQKYYKNLQRKHQFIQVKEIYKLHVQSPRLFLLEVRDILVKCHHRKRLLEYFKIAKVLGLKVESVKFSTFLFSVSKSLNPNLAKKSFDRIIGPISHYQFSEEIQKQLLDTLQGKVEKDLEINSKQFENHTKIEVKDQSQIFADKLEDDSNFHKQKSKLKIFISDHHDCVNPFQKTIKKIRRQPKSIGQAFQIPIQLASSENFSLNNVPPSIKKNMGKKRAQNKITPSPPPCLSSYGSRTSSSNANNSVKIPFKNQSAIKQQQSSTVKKIPIYEASKNPISNRQRSNFTSSRG